ncbi:MAG: hypothetical protein LUI12_04820 [Clostridiales bacterium]|nr:hypothetical protein [Clostridiales bacterium]
MNSNVLLQRIFKYDIWHITEVNKRPYACWTIEKINKIINTDTQLKKMEIVEIGCGLGDIISHIKVKNRYGLDVSEKVVGG